MSRVGEFGDGYRVYEDGTILSQLGVPIRPSTSRAGYKKFVYRANGGRKDATVHRIVAQAFLPNPQCKKTVNHKDGDKGNNHVSNLEWLTHQENIDHALATGLRDTGGERNARAILKRRDVQVIEYMLELGYRQSRIAEMFGMTKSAISKIYTGRTWGHH